MKLWEKFMEKWQTHTDRLSKLDSVARRYLIGPAQPVMLRTIFISLFYRLIQVSTLKTCTKYGCQLSDFVKGICISLLCCIRSYTRSVWPPLLRQSATKSKSKYFAIQFLYSTETKLEICRKYDTCFLKWYSESTLWWSCHIQEYQWLTIV